MSAEPAPQAAKVGVLNVANYVTMLRLLLVPLFAVFLLMSDDGETWPRVAAVVVFAVASLSDRVDGDLARRRHLVTDFGKVADPIADKALIGTAFVGLSILGEMPWWVTAIVLAREVAVTALRFAVIKHGVIPASRGGKVKTVLQAVAVGLFLLPFGDWLDPARVAFLAAALVVTVVTAVDYVLRALRLRRAALRGGA